MQSNNIFLLKNISCINKKEKTAKLPELNYKEKIDFWQSTDKKDMTILRIQYL